MTRSIGFIGGGQMAEAIVKGLLREEHVSPDQITVAEPLADRRKHLVSVYNISAVATLTEIGKESDVLLLAVKPQMMDRVLAELLDCYAHQLLITIAAGLPIHFYTDTLGDTVPIVRVMPNMGALILEGATALCRSEVVTDTDLAYVETLFNAVGSTVVVDETLMDAVTGLSGSGPAYVFAFIEALIDGGVKVGLSREIATELAIQTVYGAAACLKETGTHPTLLRDQVTSPGGTTANGLQVLDRSGFKGIIVETVEAARNRSQELGEK